LRGSLGMWGFACRAWNAVRACRCDIVDVASHKCGWINNKLRNV
jgi:hypothetical protein